MTYKLNGQIIRRQVWGDLKAVPAEVGGAKLQAKTVFPRHSEQIIKPDDDYDGLAVVTVKPVPRLPACGVDIFSDVDNIVEKVINIETVVGITGKVFVQTHALYGGVRLPLLPEDVLAQYPYCWIWKDPDTAEYKAFFSTGIWYLAERLSSGQTMTRTVAETSPWYVYSAKNDAWELLENSNANKWVGDYARADNIQWTNFNIPDGSASATTYAKTATAPGLTV